MIICDLEQLIVHPSGEHEQEQQNVQEKDASSSEA